MATAGDKKVHQIGGTGNYLAPPVDKGEVKPGQEMVVIGNGELRIFQSAQTPEETQEREAKNNQSNLINVTLDLSLGHFSS